MLRDTLSKILGERVDAQLAGEMKATIRSNPEVRGAYDLILHDYGPDRQSALINGWKLICVNTQLWRESPPEETAAQDEWLAAELDDVKTRGIPAIVLSHIPPYIAYPNEGDSWAVLTNENELRKNLLVKMTESGVRFWLAGHTHETIVRAFEGMLVMNGETTSANFDKRPYGVRLLTAEPNGDYRWDFYRVE